jgi:hypothetical protein
VTWPTSWACRSSRVALPVFLVCPLPLAGTPLIRTVACVTVRNHSVTAAFYQSSELDCLTAAFPAFRFSYRAVGRHGTCWVAERKDGLSPGLHTLITSDLAELRAALATPDGTSHAR